MEEVVDDFEPTLTWAVEEEKLRLSRTEGIGTFYLLIASFVIVVICFLVLIYGNRGRVDEFPETPKALDMMQDENNIYDIESEEINEKINEENPIVEEVDEIKE